MTKIMNYLFMIIGAFGFMHIFLGIIVGTDNEVARLWFVGSGLAILLVSLLGFSGVHRLQNDQVVSTSWIAGNVGGLAFVAYATWILPEPQNIVLLGLLVASAVTAIFTIVRFLKISGTKWCCAEKSVASG